ncbi:wax ester synthase-like acyl-CoA acyltransferase family protein [Geodermatophilus normandii]|uniref:diacylglycerol O-acyltransferase n=1 Tax=Geodermatophilus normandii TaxID=1137989 RepID=A0A317QS65_9ACTN|nr:WS/DGAT domain-containing protein [Geodermatophilus normandii]PWW24955.1 wax ester synthase-like acyl-CoA acyltransferase family protein [Geodermatophilus normandii]
MQVPLTAEDRAILALEGPQLVGHTATVVHLPGGAPDLRLLRDAVARRLPAAPRLTWRLGGTSEEPVWRPDEVDVAAHVRAVGAVGPLDAAGFRTELVRLFEEHLDRSLPLWRMDVISRVAGQGAYLVWRVHHALADGGTVMRLAEDVLWDPAPAAGGAGERRSGTAGPGTSGAGQACSSLAGVLTGGLLPGLRRSPFDARVGRERDVALAVTPVAALREAARRLAGATLNDAVLAVVAGALRRWLEHRHGSIHGLTVKVPVTLHHDGDEVGNRDSYFRVDLPVDEADPVTRLLAVRRETAQRKARHDAQQLDELMDGLARLSPRLAGWSQRLQRSGRSFALNVSNVRGPDRAVTVLDAPVGAVQPLVEVAQHHALRVGVLSVADRLGFGLVADPSVVGDLDLLAAAVEQAAAELLHTDRNGTAGTSAG